jgi:hypothetical protein
MTRAILRLAFVAAGAAIAVWLLPASLHIVSWPPGGPVRVAVLAPVGTLWVCLAGAAVFLGGVAIAGEVLGPRVPRRIAAAMDPFALLWLWAVPYLPWLPDRAPVLLALAGPLRWGVACVALFGAAWLVVSTRGWTWRHLHLPGRWAVFAISLAVYVCFGLWSAAEVGPGGDEPHYLTITQSLLLDHDLDIENNHARGDYREYFGGSLRPDYLRRGLNGAIYSIHAPGLPLLLVPAYAAAGYWGAVVLICILSALAAVAIFALAELLAGRIVAWITFAAVCLSVPFVPHSWMIYPEMAGALIAAWAVLWLYQPLPARLAVWIWRGVALAPLPWLHTKFSVLMVLLAGFLLRPLWRHPKAVAAFTAPIAISTALWLYSFYRIYGVFDPQAPYGDSARTQMLLENIPRGVLGLLFDQKFGLLPYSPIYLLVASGCWVALRRPELRVFGIALLTTFVAFLATTTRFYMWWGGSSAPARFLVPSLPLVAPLVAIALRELRSPAARAVAALLLAFSLCVAVAGVTWPKRFMLFSAPHGLAQLGQAVQAGSPLAWALPTFTEENLRPPLALLGSWLAAAAFALIVVVLAIRLKRSAAGFLAAGAGFVAFVLGAAVVAGAPAPEGRRATAARGRLALLRAQDGQRLWVWDYARGARLDERGTLAMTSVSASRTAGELSDDPEQLAGPFELPPGRFAVRIWFGGRVPDGGRAFVVTRNRAQIAESEEPLTNPTRLSFGLPLDAMVSVAFSDEALARAVQQVEIVAESVVPRSARPEVTVHALEAIGDRPGAYIVYADDKTYPEGGVFWTRSTEAGTVFIAPDGASTLVLTVHVGPVGGRVEITVADQDHSLDLTHDETRTIEIPLPPARQLVPVAVRASAHFRPRDHEPGSTDPRWLGCQVRIGLK